MSREPFGVQRLDLLAPVEARTSLISSRAAVRQRTVIAIDHQRPPAHVQLGDGNLHERPVAQFLPRR